MILLDLMLLFQRLVLIHQIRYRSTANQSNYLISFLLEHRHVF